MKPYYQRAIQKERNLSSFIPYSSHVTSNTLVTQQGDYIRIWKVGGITHETANGELIQRRMDQLNTLFRSVGSEHTSVWIHQVRRCVSDRLKAHFDNAFCAHLDRKYYESFKGYKMMANEWYFTLVYRPNPSKISKGFLKAERRTLKEIKADQLRAIRKLDELALRVESGLRRYDLEVMGTYSDEKNHLCSKALEFLNFLISGIWQKVRVPKVALNEYLGNAWVFVGTETIEIRTPTQSRYAQGIDFKDYTAHTEPGFLNSLMYEDYEYVMTQSYSFMSKHNGKAFLEKQQTQLQNTEDGAVSQIEDITEAIDQLLQGEFVMGEYHYSLLIFGNSIEEARKNTTSAMAMIQDLGFLAALVSIATDAAYYAQLPCNWFHRPRIAGINSKNFAGLASFHNFSTGKRDGNPWGQAVTLLKSPSSQPVYFNFHASKNDQDAFGQKLLGNACVIGQSGSGKTVLLTMLLCQAQKFKPRDGTGFTSIYFDKDRGAEIAIRAMGGKYLRIENGQPTGFNPFQMEPSESNILFLEKLVQKLVETPTYPLNTLDEFKISQAVRTLMRMPKKFRRLSTLIQNITEGTLKEEVENSLVKRLMRWCQGGSLGWVFDNSVDLLDFTTHNNYGFDGTDFLDNEFVRTPIAMYLLHRVEHIMDGRRVILIMDEFWKWLRDKYFSDFAFNQEKTARKKNGILTFATQSPSDTLESPISKALIEQCATEIYLPNPKADFDEYVKGFKLTESEFEVIKNFDEDSRLFLIKQGHHSAIAGLDLQGMNDELAVLSGSSDNVRLLDSIIAETGDDPNAWLPIFHERRKLNMQSSFSGGIIS